MSREAAKIAQEEYCEENDVPMFAPYNGICPWCYKDIYKKCSQEDETIKGYTARQAGRIHITSCPHCNTSFID
jgi:hypothetical protein